MRLGEKTRVAPHNIEAEQALLGAIFVNNEAFHRVSDFLNPDHFFEPLHEAIYQTCASLIRANKIANPVTLKSYLPADVDVAGMTVNQYLARLAAEATTVINAADYARTIYDLAVRRAMIVMAEEMYAEAFDAPADTRPSAQIEMIEQRLYTLAEPTRHGDGFQTFESAVVAAVQMAADAYQREGRLAGRSTGLAGLDRMMGGLQASDLIILAGRPGMGKTALATNIAYNVARDREPVGFFSLEMSAEQLATRVIADRSEIPSYRLRRGEFLEPDFRRITDAAREVGQHPLFIDETGGLSIAQLAARARRLKRQKNVKLIVVDYLQLMAGSAKRVRDGRVMEVTEITMGLKALAKELSIPILALSQLSRAVEGREDKRPQLSDLRESGSIEQDADVVMFVYREEYYLKNKEPQAGTDEHFKWQTEMERAHGKAEVILSKQRHGPTGKVDLQFRADVTRFSDLADTSRLPERI